MSFRHLKWPREVIELTAENKFNELRLSEGLKEEILFYKATYSDIVDILWS